MKKTKTKFFYGWYIVIAGSLAMALSSGINYHGFGNLFLPLSKEFGWSRTRISTVFSLARLENGILGPIDGYLIDKFGPRIVILVGVPIMSVGYILLSKVDSFLSFSLVYILGVTVGSGTLHTPIQTAVANWFNKKRGLAFGVMWSGVGIGGLLVPFYGWLIQAYGWRDTSIIIGFVILLVGVPCGILMRHNPYQYGDYPDGMKPSNDTEEDLIHHDDESYTVKEALSTSSFWLLTMATGLRILVTSGVSLHLVPFFVDLGISPVAAAGFAGSVGIMSIPGRFGLSTIGDYINKRYILVICMLCLSLGVFLLSIMDSLTGVILALILYSSSQGGSAVIPNALMADYFGIKHYGTIMGFRSILVTFGVIAGPIISGATFDNYGSYKFAFMFFAFINLIAFVMVIFSLPPKRKINV
jgi:MFS family permease|tara:strand:+ start:602 stop:1843 length:1242 start_codon:yes stop_codon:yes gene_type:complete